MLERTHIGIFGPRNAGKSTLINLLTSQQVSIVSPVAGTTTDPVSKPIEINGIGPCVFIDTAGYDDFGEVGSMRVSRTKEIAKRCDMAIFVLADSQLADPDAAETAKKWFGLINERCERTLLLINIMTDGALATSATAERLPAKDSISLNLSKEESRAAVLERLGHIRSRVPEGRSIAAHLVARGGLVVLVMPQDAQAPAGRLILPQVQVIRELLDHQCRVMCTTTATFSATIESLRSAPDLIITDSQAFAEVYRQKPESVRLTSFSVLMARWKGDIDEYVAGVRALSSLSSKSKVLIAEACAHAPLSEDIGREKIPNLIHSRIDEGIHIDFAAGADWNGARLDQYDLIIQCGACMVSRAQVQSLIADARRASVPITNYGVTLAYFTKILEKIVW